MGWKGGACSHRPAGVTLRPPEASCERTGPNRATMPSADPRSFGALNWESKTAGRLVGPHYGIDAKFFGEMGGDVVARPVSAPTTAVPRSPGPNFHDSGV